MIKASTQQRPRPRVGDNTEAPGRQAACSVLLVLCCALLFGVCLCSSGAALNPGMVGVKEGNVVGIDSLQTQSSCVHGIMGK